MDRLPDPSSRFPGLHPYLRRWGARLRLVESLTWGAWGLAVGLGAGLALALAARLWPLLLARQVAGLGGLAALIGAAVGIAVAWLRPRPLPRLARVFDRRFGLAERMLTAVEIGTGRLRAMPAMAEAQLTDTLEVARHVEPRLLLPLRVSRWVLLALAGLTVAFAFALWLPNPQEDALLQQAAVEEAIEEQIEALEALKEEVVQAEELSDEEREDLLRKLEETIEALQGGRATPEEALAALAELEQALAELRDPEVADLEAGLEEAAEALADSELTREIAEALAEGDYQKAADALAEAGERELTPEEARELAEQLEEAAEALEEADPELARQLEEAAEALERGGLSPEEARELAQQLDETDPDLARQLEEAAEALERGALSPEEARELAQQLEEAAEALQETDPELAQRLGEAAEALESGDTTEAREALKEAAGQMEEAGELVETQKMIEDALAGLQEGRAGIVEAGGELASGGPGDPGHHEDAGSGAPYDEEYEPDRIEDGGRGVDVGREGGDGIPIGSVSIPAPEGDRAGVPYEEVYTEYAEEAGAALEGSYIPLGMKQYVRDYFGSLEP